MKIGDTCIGFTGEEIVAAVMDNDIDTIESILKEFELNWFNQPAPFFDESKRISCLLLNYAIVFSTQQRLTMDTASLLIDAISINVNSFQFLDTILFHLKVIRTEKYEVIPKRILDILEKNVPNDELNHRVACLQVDEFLTLAEYLTSGKKETMNVTYTLPFIRYVFSHELIPLNLLFAYMVSALREPNVTNVDVIGIIGQIVDGIMGEEE